MHISIPELCYDFDQPEWRPYLPKKMDKDMVAIHNQYKRDEM